MKPLSNFVQRTLLCIFAVPAVIAIVFLIPQYHFIGFAVFVLFMGILGGTETSKILNGKITLFGSLSWVPALLEYLSGQGEVALCLLVMASLAVQIKEGEKDDFKESINKVLKDMFTVIYPGFFLIYVMKFLRHEKMNSYLLMLYIILVISNEICSYIWGRLFGRGNAGVFKVSPKKSTAGFIGGFLSDVAITMAYCHFCKANLPEISIATQIMLGFVMCFFGNAGDLAESVLKRSAGIKDSGHIIPGRGGALDCIDTAAFCAPLFYFFVNSL